MLRPIFAAAAFAVGIVVLTALAPAEDKKPSGITVDKDKKTVSIDAKVAPRKIRASIRFTRSK